MRATSVLVVLVAALAATSAFAKDVPTLGRRVNDQAGALSPSDVERIEQKLAAYEQRTGHQLAVLIVKSLDGEVLEQYSIKVAEQWKLGDQKRDDGALLLVAIDEHAVRIEVGYGLEGAVPDVIASRIIRDIMIPRFQQNDDVAGAIDAGLDALMTAAQGESIGAPPPLRRAPSGGSYFGLLLMLAFALLYVRRFIRAPIFGVGGALVGWAASHALVPAVIGGVVGFILGAVLPVLRSRGGGGFGGVWLGGSSSTWSGGGGGGGFSGGGGGFGGGGASGRW